jgi:methionyl-tRNA formyltransferase
VRLTFLGNDLWSVPSLEALAGSTHEVALVVTREPRPAGRGGKLRPTAVAEAARRVGLPVEEVATVKGGPGLEVLRESLPDVLAVVAYGEILPSEILDLPTEAPINVHFSLLPALRGADPVRRAILEGLEVTGVTTMRMDEGMDTGPILLQAEEPIREEDDAGSLGARLADRGGKLLVETLDRLEVGPLEERPQDRDAATLAPKLRPEDEWVDWSEPAEAVCRRIRALAPDPGARTRFRGKVLKLYRARPVLARGEPGTVVEVPEGPFAVAAGEGAVLLEEVLPEGKGRMTGEAFARGRRPEPGETLG